VPIAAFAGVDSAYRGVGVFGALNKFANDHYNK
jgi:hypothetical protein